MAKVFSKTGPHPVDRYVGRRVAERRIAMGYNQGNLASALGITFQQIQKYEKGANRISSSKLWQAAGFLGVDIAYFFEGLTRNESPGDADWKGLDPNFSPTPQTVEIGRLAPQLTPSNQRLVLELVRALADTEKSSAAKIKET